MNAELAVPFDSPPEPERNGSSDLTISMVKFVADTETHDASFAGVMADISAGRWREQVAAVRTAYATGGKDAANEFKKRLPGVLWSGTFKRRSAKELIQHSGLICVDLDDLGAQAESYRDLIIADEHTVAAFISPTGTGLKVIFRCDPAKPHATAYAAAEHYVLAAFGLAIDPACKDVCRLCFVSHDADAFVSKHATLLPEAPTAKEFVAPLQLSEMRPANDPVYLVTPGDDYDQRADIPSLLKKHGWTHVNGVYWRRPGKTSDNSATWNHVPNRFWVFSSSTAFEPNHLYRPWHVFAILECNKDFSAAARQLNQLGFGSRIKPKPDRIYDPGYEEPTPEKVERKPYTVWTPAQFRAYQPPPNMNLLGSGYLRRRQLTTLIGPPGVGKSRLSLWLGCSHITNREFMGLDTANGPAKWLFFGNENDPLRQKNDLEWFYRNLTAVEQVAVDSHLFMHVLEQPDDGIITLADPDAYAKLQLTLQSIVPDVVVFDPWGSMIEGNENDNEEVRKTLKLLLRAVMTHCPNAAVLVIHHARTGKSVAIEAGNNYSGGSLGRGSKALVSAARCELALWPGHSEDSSRLVLTCEKVNNVKKFEPKGLIFENGAYREDSDFSVEAWRDDIENTRGSPKTITIADLVEIVKSGVFKAKDLYDICEDRFEASRATVTRRLKDAVAKGWLAKTVPSGSYTLGDKSEKAPR